MADFNSDFWHWYIAILTILSILACVWLIRWMTWLRPRLLHLACLLRRRQVGSSKFTAFNRGTVKGREAILVLS